MTNTKLFLLILLTALVVSCNKDDESTIPPPTGRVFGQVMHHDELVPNATVYIKYDAIEFPGTDPSLYDDLRTASEVDATFEFANLGKGSYYLFSSGYDTLCPCSVIGGLPVALNTDKGTYETIVPVTE